MDRLEVRVSLTKVLLILIVVIVPLSIFGLVLTTRSDRSLDNAIGNDYKALAQRYSNEVSDYIRDRVADVNAMAADSSVISAASGADRTGSGKNAASGQPAGKGMLGSTASEFLGQRRNLDPRFLNIVVTDQNGTVVAAAQQTGKQSYADDGVWQGAYNKGQGAVKIGDILYAEVPKAYYVNIGVPVGDPSSGRLVGVLTAAVNISPVLAHFQENEIGNGARAILVNDDGTIVSAPNADVFARLKSTELEGIRDTPGALQGTQSSWRLVRLQSGPYIVGFAATGLKQNYNNLGWIVLVSQGEHQAAAPIRQLERFAAWMVVLAVFMLTLLCVYYFLHRKQKFAGIEEAIPSDQPEQTRAAASSTSG
jgi:preprotein translocase subunit SecG